MPRPLDLPVDVSIPITNSTISSNSEKFISTSSIAVNQLPVYKQVQPSFYLLFSSLSRRDRYCFFIPAIIASLASGGIAPFMTIAVGGVFNAFAQYPSSNPSQDDKDKLLHSVGISAIELLALAVGALVLSSVTSSLWISTGERNVLALRRRVYLVVTQKDMTWFDKKMGFDESVKSAESDGPMGAGGMMAQFAKDTDDVRAASSLSIGLTIQYITTSLTALAIGFYGSWAMTLVVLATFPVLIFLGGLSQGLSQSMIVAERSLTAVAATLVDRAVAAIATVKAFNAVEHERNSLRIVLQRSKAVAGRLVTVWGLNLGLTQFFMMSMFVQAFWFGSKLVRNGTITPGQVMTVFWACLIATSNLHMAIQQLITITKGKSAMASIVNLIEAPLPVKESLYGFRGISTQSNLLPLSRKVNKLKQIVPSNCHGALELVNVSFAYLSRPTIPVLDSVTMFFAPGDITFVVGGSGSGKSTVAQLLARIYTQQCGQITLDQNDMEVLDEEYTRQHIALVSQTCIMFDMSVHDNVAMGLTGSPSGRRPQDVTREEVMEACRIALMHEFIRDLPDGYDTLLGNGGANLSGGQKQRLAIARAYLRNPTVLILDEAVSALDATSRLLVFEAIKQWRMNKTTIVITHDLTQISDEDFVFVLKDGMNVEAGFRSDLEQMEDGYFTEMAKSQGSRAAPERNLDQIAAEKEQQVQTLLNIEEQAKPERPEARLASLRPISFGNWMFDVVSDLTSKSRPQLETIVPPPRASRLIAPETSNTFPRPRRPSTVYIPSSFVNSERRLSLQFSLTSPTSTMFSQRREPPVYVVDDEDFDMEKAAMKEEGMHAAVRREKGRRARRDPALQTQLYSIEVDTNKAAPSADSQNMTFLQLMRAIYPTVPHKFVTVLGLVIATASGAMTPVFAFVLSQLLVEVSAGAKNVSLINKYGGLVLGLAALDGLLLGLKYFILQKVATSWVMSLRDKCYNLVLRQDKKWFDKLSGENGPLRMVQVLIKDGDDARSLIATVFPQMLVVVAMFGTGIIWAMVRGWQLTLVGIAIAPIFVVTMALQNKLVNKCELRNKRAREQVAKQYYEAISNVRSIRAMAFEKFFEESFEKAIQNAHSAGVKGAFVEGCTYGVSSSLIYLSEAILFYVSAIFVVRGIYSYLQMVEVLDLLVFTVSLGSQLMGFAEYIAKSVQATKDFYRLLQLNTDSDESHGTACPPIMGTLSLSNVSFTYPERPEVQVLNKVSLDIADGESVAVVGSSGSGKSTIAALLQRLYHPTSGTLTIGSHDLSTIDVNYLREHVAVVSQNPNLFDATITENISYGSKNLSFEDVQLAARAANVHDFIMSLPKGYDTTVGENASLISGGQAQRIQIARALARPSKILILDECTSALDPANQAFVLDAIRRARVGRTTLMVTHKLPVMKMCDRIVVVDHGRIVEEGTYEQLMARRSVFAQLANGGEWVGL